MLTERLMHLGQEPGQPLLQLLGAEVAGHRRPSQNRPRRLLLDGAEQHRDHLDTDDLIGLLVVSTDAKHDGDIFKSGCNKWVAHRRNRFAAEVDEELISWNIVVDVGSGRIDGGRPTRDTVVVSVAHGSSSTSLLLRFLTR